MPFVLSSAEVLPPVEVKGGGDGGCLRRKGMKGGREGEGGRREGEGGREGDVGWRSGMVFDGCRFVSVVHMFCAVVCIPNCTL